jgi:carboxyl-terminal processing protease
MQHLKTGERHLDLALPWDTVDPASYTKWDGDTIDLKAVKSKSAPRVELDQNFIDISLTSKRASERREKTRQSLNIHDIRKERAEENQLQESAGSGFHDSGSGGNPDSKRTAKSDEEKRALWEKGLLEEPYLEEAMAVLADVVSISSGLATEIAPAGDEL